MVDNLGFLWYNSCMLFHLQHKPIVTAVDRTTPLPESPEYILEFDGSCRPNPGPMGIGYRITDTQSRILVQVGAQIGQGTNNIAEYHALLSGLRHALKLGLYNLTVRSDSLLVVNQFKGIWKARDKTLRRLCNEAVALGGLFKHLRFHHVYREANYEADKLSRLLVFFEPTLPSLVASRKGRFPKLLHDWQAAAVRVWSLTKHPGSGVLARIFGISLSAIEQIERGETYKEADFKSYIRHMEDLNEYYPRRHDVSNGGESGEGDDGRPGSERPSDPLYSAPSLVGLRDETELHAAQQGQLLGGDNSRDTEGGGV